MQMYVPVVGKTGKPLMPTSNYRANELIRKGRALRRFSHGIFYIQLTDRVDGDTQDIACGVDPGSKKEGYTVKSECHTFLNIECDAITHVKDSIKQRRDARRSRRGRKTPYRKNRKNKKRSHFQHSSRSRWNLKLNILNVLKSIIPISCYVVEDIKANTFKGKKWNQTFSPLEIGKNWFYDKVRSFGDLTLVLGWETKQLRDDLKLKKSKSKLSGKFESHCVDSWVLANFAVGGDILENRNVFHMKPIRFHRRQLHVFNPTKGGVRKPYGGTRSLCFKRGSIVDHIKHGITYIGGTSKGRVSLHNLSTGNRICQNAKLEDLKFICFNSYIYS